LNPRPFWHYIVLAILSVFALIVVGMVFLTGNMEHRYSDPVSVSVECANQSDIEEVKSSFDFEWIPVFSAHDNVSRDSGVYKREIANVWVDKIKIHIPSNVIENVRKIKVDIGKKSYIYEGSAGLDQWKKTSEENGIITFESPESLKANKSVFPGINKIINWPGDLNLFKVSLELGFSGKNLRLYLIVLFILISPALVVRLGIEKKSSFKKWFIERFSGEIPIEDRVEDDKVENRGANFKYTWLTIGFIILVICIVYLEIKQKFYFTADDNFVEFLPVIIKGCRSLLGGNLLQWDAFQFMGAPVTDLGIYSLTYPFTYISYIISRFILGNENLTIEVFSITHILIGFFTTYWACRSVGMKPPLSTAATLSFILSGFSLIAGRSWYYMTPVLLFAPLLIVAVSKPRKSDVGWKWAVAVGVLTGIFFHAGNVQMWMYSVGFFVLAVIILVWTKSIPFRRALWAIPAILLGVAIAEPLLLPQMAASKTFTFRVGGWGDGIGNGLLSMILPSPLVRSPLPNDWGNQYLDLAGQFYYSGTVFTMAGFVAVFLLIGLIMAYRCNDNVKKALSANIWIILAFIAFIPALGNKFFVWPLLSGVPIIRKFTNPFKFLIFINLFFAVGGGIFIERSIRALKNRVKWERIVATSVCLLMIYNVFLARTSFYTFGDVPYPPLPVEMKNLLSVPSGEASKPQRLLSLSPARSSKPGYVPSLDHNFATLYDVLSIWGYDERLVSASGESWMAENRLHKNPLETARVYGVKWIIIHNSLINPEHFNPHIDTLNFKSMAKARKLLETKQLKPVLVYPILTVFEIQDVSPMAFIESKPGEALPVMFHSDGMSVKLPGSYPGDRVIVNVLLRKNINVYGDQKLIPASPDEWGRIIAKPEPGTGSIEIKYEPPWKKGIVAGVALGILSIIMIIGLCVLERFRAV